MVYLLLILPPIAASVIFLGIVTVVKELVHGYFLEAIQNIFLCLIAAFFCILCPIVVIKEDIKTKEEKEEREEREARLRELKIQTQKARASALNYLPIVQSPELIILRRGERCHYQVSAEILELENEVVGYQNNYSGSSINWTENWTTHSGGGHSVAIRDLVPYTYPGMFTITSSRVVMTGDRGFDEPIMMLTSIKFLPTMEGAELQFGSDTYKVLLEDPFMVERIFKLLLGSNHYLR